MQLRAERDGIELTILGDERMSPDFREDARGQQALIGGLGAIVTLRHAGTVACLGGELPHRLKEVPVETQDLVDGGEMDVRSMTGVPIVTNEPAHDGPILLLGVGLVVLAPGSAAGEVDAFLMAPWDEQVIEKLAAIVGMELAQRHGQTLADVMEGGADALLSFAPDGLAFGPAGGDVHRDEGAKEEAVGTVTAMADQIRLQAARTDIVPLAEGAHRHLSRDGGPAAPGRGKAAGVSAAIGTQEPIDRGGADPQEPRPQRRWDVQDVVALESVGQCRQERRQPFAAEIITGFPEAA